ncbi:non-ribosomal peptide synthetase/type I polyketide synthase [Acanthopleuribacter pedis]|uniref:Amino acid adenylation domain-containing protein n=1 Tax=Acanthopleuribacter pedis TaxID=442870 RepID=A0A8J7QQM6_9BACT|nr:non-ribosomal peptide synthetase/type I polyketide synthase [Acanthopleuribacter pedis]MBO1322390.1 amino acid adenylation domain-containing protein [Acanthopleuribacter pedis]
MAGIANKKGEVVEQHPLTEGQKALWYLYTMDPEGRAYNINYAWYVRSKLDSALLKDCLAKLVARYDTWRSTYSLVGKEPMQLIHDTMPTPFEVIKVAGLSDEEMVHRLDEEVYASWDLDEQAPIRWILFDRGDKDPVLWFQMHHIGMDVHSVMLALDELSKLYAAAVKGETAELEPITVQNKDWAEKQNAILDGEEGQKLKDFWLDALKGERPPLGMPVDGNRPAFPNFKGKFIKFPIPRAVSDALGKVASETEVSLFGLYLSLYQLLLHRYTGQKEILVGTPTLGRTEEFDRVFAYLVSPICFHTTFEGNPEFSAYVKNSNTKAMRCIKNQMYPFPRLVQELETERDASRASVFQTLFVWENPNRFLKWRGTDPIVRLNDQGEEDWDLGEIKLERQWVKFQLDEFDLALKIVKHGPDFYGVLDYSSDLFNDDTMQRFCDNYANLLGEVAANHKRRIGHFPMMNQAQQQEIIDTWNATDRTYPPAKCLHELMESTAAVAQDSIAVVFEDQHVTFDQFNRRANQLAHYLRKKGVGPEIFVGVCMERSIELEIALQGILKAGGAYVPLDPGLPEKRLVYMAGDAKVPVLITQSHLLEKVPESDAVVLVIDRDWAEVEKEPDTKPDSGVAVDNAAYMIYTSGSTGNPKGVVNTHRGIYNRLMWKQDAYNLTPDDRVLQKTPFSFDVSVWEHFWAPMIGARLVMAKPEGHKDGSYLIDLIKQHGITTIHFVPSMLQVFLEEDNVATCTSLKRVLCSGEALPWNLQERFYSLMDKAELHNLYGPTEAAVDVTWWACPRDYDRPLVPIGKAITNTQIYVLDKNFMPVPIGVAGELCIGGIQVSRGYNNRFDLTADKFVPDPFTKNPGVRMYRTGDLVRFMDDGNIEYISRIDFQVKIRGFRIEIGEIEATIAEHSNIRETVVVVREMGGLGEKQLVAYSVAKENPAPTNEEMRTFLTAKMPDYMVPSAFVFLDELPLSPNGKVDRKQLPEPSTDRPELSANFVRPQNEFEEAIAQVWREVLKIQNIGIHDKFFDLGGNSLQVVAIRKLLKSKHDIKITNTDLFQYPTISALAEHLAPSVEKTKATYTRKTTAGTGSSDIAIIGMAGRFPGADTIDAFWDNVRQGVESIKRFTKKELENAGVDRELLNDDDYVGARGVLNDVAGFDAGFFGFSPREAEVMDPQQRLFLEITWEALESAGYNPETFPGRIGCFAGVTRSEYFINNIMTNPRLERALGPFQIMLLNDKDFLPTRVAFKFNLRGPALNVQTACSTSLVAIHQACRSLISGECDQALAGGVSIQVPQVSGYLYNEGGIHSPDGHVRAFDAEAKGMVVSSGAGVVLLKRLDEAVADGDNIHAVIRATAINNDGANKVGYTAPSVDGQAEVIAETHAVAGINAESVTYIETHGTGTNLGDPIEIAALNKAFRYGTQKSGFCRIGSLKSNVGHLDSAAGVAGLIKTALSLKHKLMPPSLHFKNPNPDIDFESTPFVVNTDLHVWEHGDTPRRAGISSFGIGGTNAHALLEEFTGKIESDEGRDFHVLTLSARTPDALQSHRENLLSHLKNNPDQNLADIAFTLMTGRKLFANRCSLVVGNVAEAISILEDGDTKKIHTGFESKQPKPVVFMFSGQGAQYPQMGRDLYENEPYFKEQVDHCADLLKPWFGSDIRDLIYPEITDEEGRKAAAAELNKTSNTQPALFVIEYATAKTWLHWGVKPQFMIGHSIGEYVAACIAGVVSLEDALRMVTVRGRLMFAQPTGSMLAVPMPAAEAEPKLPANLTVAAINMPSRCVVAGPTDAIEGFKTTLEGEEIKSTVLHTSHAFHSAMMDGMLDEFTNEVRKLKLNPPQIPYVSNLTGKWITDAEATDPSYYAQHLRQAVRFADGVETLLEKGDQLLLEVGPGKALATFARGQVRRKGDSKVITSLRHPKDQLSDIRFLQEALSQLWVEGVAFDFGTLYADQKRRRVPLPTYPFERRRFWVDPGKEQAKPKTKPKQLPTPRKTAPAPASGPRKFTSLDDWFNIPIWKQATPPPSYSIDRLSDRSAPWLVFADECGLGHKLVDRLERDGVRLVTVIQGERFEELGRDHYSVNPKEQNDYTRLLQKLTDAGTIPANIVHLWSVTPSRLFRERKSFAENCQNMGFYSLIWLAQAIDEANLLDPIKLFVISNHMQEIIGGDLTDPEKATLLGPLKVIPREYPHIATRSIDIAFGHTPNGNEAQIVEQLLSEVTGRKTDQVLAWRGNNRWVQSYESMNIEPLDGPRGLRPAGVYLITGGMGGIGQVIAEFLAETVKAKLVLVGRSTFPRRDEWEKYLAQNDANDRTSQKIQRLKKLESLGAEVMVASADVTDTGKLRDIADQASYRFGTIHGVIHAAGLYPNGMIGELTRENTANMLAAKVYGTLALDEVFRDRHLDFMVLFSSTSTILANMGFADYCAVNAFLDAFSFYRNSQERKPTLAINWDGWREVGMAVDMDLPPEQQEAHNRRLATMMANKDGVEAFHRALSVKNLPQIVVSPFDLTTMLTDIKNFMAAQSQIEAPKPATTTAVEPAATAVAVAPPPPPPVQKSDPVRDRPKVVAEFHAPDSNTQKQLTELWQDALGINEIGKDDEWSDLGGDSLSATMLTSKIRRKFKVKVSPHLFNEKPTIAQMAAHLDEQMGVKRPAPAPAAPAPAPVAAAPAPTPAPAPAPAPAASNTAPMLTQLWQDALGIDEIGADDVWTDLGGDSLSATMLTANIRRKFKVKISPHLFNEKPTIAQMSAHLDGLMGKAPAAPAPAPAPVTAPKTETETTLVGLLSELTGKAPLSTTAKLTELGVNAGWLLQHQQALQNAFGLPIGPDSLSDHQDVVGLAQVIDTLAWTAQNMAEAAGNEPEEEEEFEL